MKNVAEPRYDLDLLYTDVDTASVLALADLVDGGHARAALRQVWIDRNDPVLALDRFEVYVSDIHDAFVNDWK